MQKIIIIGNLVHSPDLRTTPSGLSVCSFDVAVNRREKSDGKKEADFFRVNAWRQLADLCSMYLDKGRKVCVVGKVSVRAYMGKEGEPRASMEVTADEVEFLSPRSEEREPVSTAMPSYSQEQLEHARQTAVDGEFTEITDGDLPF